jgi:uncharacterized protein (TIGR02246 family)
MRKFAALAAALACLALVGPVRADDPGAVRKAVDAGNAGFLAAWKAGDAKAFAALFDEEGALLETGGTVVHGRDAIRRAMAETFEKIRMTEGTITTTDVFVMGDLAYETGRYRFAMKAPDKGPRTVSGRYVELWKRQADGSWRMYRDIGLPDSPAR